MIPLIPSPQLSPSTLKQMHDYRLARVRQAMAEQNISLCVLANPISLRYAIDFDEAKLHDALYDIEVNFKIFQKQLWDTEI